MNEKHNNSNVDNSRLKGTIEEAKAVVQRNNAANEAARATLKQKEAEKIKTIYYEIKKQQIKENISYTSSFFVLNQEKDELRFIMLYNEKLFDINITVYNHYLKHGNPYKATTTDDEDLACKVFEIVQELVNERFIGILISANEISVIEDDTIFPIYIDDECVSLDHVLTTYFRSYKLKSRNLEKIEDFSIEKLKNNNLNDIEEHKYPKISICDVCNNVHLSRNLHRFDDCGDRYCDDCIEYDRVVECSCIHHINRGYFIKTEDAEYIDEEGNYYCEEYDEDGGVWFDNDDEETDYYEDMWER